ncbi:MAG: tetraacyldisaccharide 4'-kinase [Gammaproteobacteria bacterium]|nr:tetraacyldisaccharide 4'-kinase [Gammaproteobacteria bacterium]
MSVLVWPLSLLFRAVASLRRRLYRNGMLTVVRLPVPVIIVGNITAGGTGKTPLVIHLVQILRKAGYRPGVIARGYRGRARHWPQAVSAGSDPSQVGDEPVLIALRGDCPVMVGPDRVAAAQALLASHDCNVLISDDGLQHYRLGRNIEIVVIDGLRRFGNGGFLPAGPLREPLSRLAEADAIVTHGGTPHRHDFAMQLRPGVFYNLTNPAQQLELTAFTQRQVHAVAGIGHPARFFAALRALGCVVQEHPFADHHPFAASDIDFGDALPVIMTEKDAVKCRGFAGATVWVLQVEAELSASFDQRVFALLAEC